MRSNDEIVDILIAARERKGISINELADMVKIAKSSISRYENKSRTFPISQLENFSKFLSLDPAYVLGFNNKNLVQISDDTKDASVGSINSPIISIKKVNDINDINNGDPIILKKASTIKLYFFSKDPDEKIISLTNFDKQFNYRYESFDISKVLGKIIINVDMTSPTL